MITKNFRLNALANQYAAALYQHITTTSGGHFMIDAASQPIRVEIAGGVKGVRDLIDGYALEALKEHYPQWESVGIGLLEKCVNAGGLTDTGREIWQSMTADMGATVGGHNA
ncbi:hypothetical protein AAF034_000020 [Salmonella enterica]|uniref:Prophage protein n=3 Tax=Enterobacter cloacae complex TaxID=354276 RepID=A0A2J0PDQ0_9ENTR|nr:MULTISPECIES: hypothetical protein [Enterobacter]EFD4934348.1 hypothetical protein [Escherichia coli]EKS4014132.1 hypothetical protein [Salmonella enterica]MBT1896915.1 hypothetical protein [Enterobacter hormaechei subsp. xiangfangensis]EFM3270610.1 hypothetical protein [Escherichia coli]EFN4396481.1 hypothetical protein [Escherichia coli]